MNFRKTIGYNVLCRELDFLVGLERSQIKLSCKIGKLVNARAEKSAVLLRRNI